jgi:AcrR family transcriptional regulator
LANRVRPKGGARRGHKQQLAGDQLPAMRTNAVKKTGRTARTRLRTRQKLITAARKVMGHNGGDNATIAEIAEEADVAFGTFYNYFESKSEISRAVFAACTEELSAAVKHYIDEIEDVPLAISFIGRTIITKARQDPIWAWFMTHTQAASAQFDHAFRQMAEQHFRQGVIQGRMIVENIQLAVTLSFACLVAAMKDIYAGNALASIESDAVELLLRMYGVSASEARTLACVPLPERFGGSVGS